MDTTLETMLKKMEQTMIQSLIETSIPQKKPKFTVTTIPFEATQSCKEMKSFFQKDSMFDTFKQVCKPLGR